MKLSTLFVAGLLSLPTFAAPAPAQVAPVPTAEEEKAMLELADGFEINLFAADPAIDKPIQMNFDPAGRLWLVSSETYPQIKPGDTANDKVIVLEDDGTGKAKAAKIFTDGLLIPTGVAYGNGGVYVGSSTELLFFKEGADGKAASTRVVLSGFGTEDTHHIVHTLRWGPDGRLYFNQSVYIHSHLETPWGVKRLNGGGIWRMEPKSMQLEVFVKGMWNTWGQAWDDYGQSLGTDGAGNEGINYNVPGAVYPASPGAERILHGLNPGSPKYAGCEIAGGRHLPEDYQGLLLTNDFRASRVVRFQISDDGSGFAARQLSDLVKSRTNVFRPVDIKMGPDGAIYIADWCNPIINHGEVDFRDPRRDHSHGRIWRLTYKGRALVEKPELIAASINELLEDLKSPEPYTRQQAKRVLAERDAKEVAAGLAAFVPSLTSEHDKLEALWVYESIDTVEPKLLGELLNAKDGRVRAAAVRTLSHWHEQLPRGRDWLAKSITDEYPRVRLEAIRALADYPSVESFELALSALDRPRDRFIDYGLWLTTKDLQAVWQPALEGGKLKLPAKKLAFALQSIGSKDALRPLLEELAAGQMSADDKAGLLDSIASNGGPEDLAPVFEMAVSNKLAAPLRVELLTALETAARQRKVAPKADLAKLKELFGAEEGLRVAAVKLAGAAKVEALRGALGELAGAKDTAESSRQAAIAALAQLGGRGSVDELVKLCAADQPIHIRITAATALSGPALKRAAQAAVEIFSGDLGGADPTPLFNAFIRRKDADAVLVDALKDKKINPDAAKLGVRALYQASRADSPLMAALNTAGGISQPVYELTKEQMASLIVEVQTKGDPARGEAIYRRKELSCLQCHAIAGSGGIVAPDLLSLGASSPVDYIVDSILLPNKAVKEGYNSLIITTKDGEQITGIRVRQNDKELVLRDATRDEIPIALSNIKSSRNGGSIMPQGLTDMLTHQEFVDLVRFLAELGKGPYASAGVPVARRWKVLEQFLPEATSATPASLDANTALTWRSEYARVDGVLPLESFRVKGRAMIRTQLNVSTPGTIELKLNSGDNVMVLWFDNKLVDANGPIKLEAGQGVHTLTFVVEHSRRTEGLRLELVEVPGSPAKAQFVGGK